MSAILMAIVIIESSPNGSRIVSGLNNEIMELDIRDPTNNCFVYAFDVDWKGRTDAIGMVYSTVWIVATETSSF